jgi:hypothetical protein
MSRRLKSFLAALAFCSVAAPAAAVTFGVPDGNGHPFVGTILFQRPDGFYSCTGTMLNPTVMLTAGHCTEEGGVANIRTWVTFTPKIQFSTGCNGDTTCLVRYFDNAKNGWIKGTAYPHPDYDDFNQFPATFDVGIIKLSKAVSMPSYGTLPPIGFLATVKPADNNFTVVGYGMQGFIPAFSSDIWERYVGHTRLVELKSTWDGGHSAKFTNNPGSTSGGTCFGDSGGPIFYQDTNMIVAVVSWGQTPCIGVDYNFRTDLQTTQDFVKMFAK